MQDHAAKTQDTLVDAVENAEVAEIKRAVFQQVCTTASTMSHLILSLACNSAAVIVSFGC